LLIFSSIRRKTPPNFEPISLSEAKQHLRIMDGVHEDDAYIMALISSARMYFENRVGQTTTLTQWQAKAKGWWTCSCVGTELPYPPLTTPTNGDPPVAITWKDGDGNVHVVDQSDIVVDEEAYPGTVRYCGASEPPCESNATVTWWAGVNSPAEIPQMWKTAMLLLVGHWYENRQAVVTDSGAIDVPMSFDMVIGACSYDGRG
jgi:uncharacterized phiE125 gp8 family phage protein